jgi:hypothetical protein
MTQSGKGGFKSHELGKDPEFKSVSEIRLKFVCITSLAEHATAWIDIVYM